jgi:hypothetical protein
MKKGKLTIEEVKKFNPIGITDDYLDPKEANGAKYSIAGRARHLSVQSAK